VYLCMSHCVCVTVYLCVCVANRFCFNIPTTPTHIQSLMRSILANGGKVKKKTIALTKSLQNRGEFAYLHQDAFVLPVPADTRLLPGHGTLMHLCMCVYTV
jgi:hypothetical protein